MLGCALCVVAGAVVRGAGADVGVGVAVAVEPVVVEVLGAGVPSPRRWSETNTSTRMTAAPTIAPPTTSRFSLRRRCRARRCASSRRTRRWSRISFLLNRCWATADKDRWPAWPVGRTLQTDRVRADAETEYEPGHPLDLRRTLGPLVRGRFDPTHRVDERGVWRTAATPEGPGTVLLQRFRGGVRAQAWGPGAHWLVAGVPELLGVRDRPEEFVADHPVLRDAERRLAGLRFPRTRLVFEMTVAAILEQKVTGREAKQSWRQLVWRFGSPPPGPAPRGMHVAPTALVVRRIPSWEWHRAGVDGKRSRAALAAADLAPHLERTLCLDDPVPVLRAVPGIGVWTAAEVTARAHGCADSVSYGDFHVPGTVGWVLAGRPFDDAQLEAYLRPWAGHRGRVVRLVESSGIGKPRFGPRYAGRDYRAI